jgi:hypothetical protein
MNTTHFLSKQIDRPWVFARWLGCMAPAFKYDLLSFFLINLADSFHHYINNTNYNACMSYNI